jgi:hypothetical protein
MNKTLLEAVRALEAQAQNGEEVDKDKFFALLTEAKKEAMKDDELSEADAAKAAAAKKLAEANAGAGSGKMATDDDCTEAEKVKKAQLEESERAAKAETDRLLEAARKGETLDSLTPEKAKELFPSIFNVALKEAEKTVGSGVDALRAENANLKALASMRESTEVARTLLKASPLKESAAVRLLPQLIGKDTAEMTKLIEAEVNYLKDYGILGRPVEGAGGNETGIHLREAEGKANTSLLLSGVTGE